MPKGVPTKTKTCPICGDEFLPEKPSQRYCKKDHYQPCPVCGKPVHKEFTRIVGVLTPVNSWSEERKEEGVAWSGRVSSSLHFSLFEGCSTLNPILYYYFCPPDGVTFHVESHQRRRGKPRTPGLGSCLPRGWCHEIFFSILPPCYIKPTTCPV